jgi:hypothetical protein
VLIKDLQPADALHDSEVYKAQYELD